MRNLTELLNPVDIDNMLLSAELEDITVEALSTRIILKVKDKIITIIEEPSYDEANVEHFVAGNGMVYVSTFKFYILNNQDIRITIDWLNSLVYE